MNAASARLVEPRHLAAVGGALLAAAIGALAGVDPKFAIAASFGIAFVLIAIVDLAVGVAIFGVLTFLELAPVAGGPAVSFAKVAGLTLAISWLAIVATDQGGSKLIFSRHPFLILMAVFLVAWAALSSLWAEDPGVAISTVGRYALNIALFPIVFTAFREGKHVRWIAASLAIGATLAATYGLVVVPSASSAATSITAAGELDRISGTVGDPNLLASVLVVGLVMSLAVALDQGRASLTRLLGLGSGGLCMLAVFATVSRGGVIALAAALVAAIIFGGPRRGRIALGAVSIATIAVAYFVLVASTAQIDRLTEADGGSGRTDIWKVGWRMVQAHPVRGVGGGNFPVSSVHYLLAEPGAVERSDFIVDTPSVAHNLYLEILAELGIVGLTFFLALVAASVTTAIQAARRFERIGEDGLAIVARATAVGISSTLAADFFLSAEYSKLLWLLLSLGPAMLAVAGRLESAQDKPTVSQTAGG